MLGKAGPIAGGGTRVSASRMGTGAQGGSGDGEARPMTSVSGAGYKGSKSFDPLGQGVRGPAPPLAERADNSPEDKAKELEKGVCTHTCMDTCI